MPRARLGNLPRALARSRLPPNGIILLSTVATQAVALMALRLCPAVPVAGAAAATLMALGALCYVVAVFLIVRGHAGGGWRLATDWANGNCILHGALSITPASPRSSAAGSARARSWRCGARSSPSSAAVEAIEIARLVARVAGGLGWREAVLVYDVSQWARNFTFGMFYAFTFAFAARYPIVAAPSLEALRDAVATYGAYVVLALLLVRDRRCCLFGARPGARPRPAVPPPPPGG